MATEQVWFACKKCRTRLFTESDIDPHEPGFGQQSFSWTKREKKTNTVVCSSHFINHTMEWMGDASDPEGKLDCPKCKGRIGSFTWHGAQCSCGHWCTPALQVLQSRVDKIKPITSVSIRNQTQDRPTFTEPSDVEVKINEDELQGFLG